MSRHQVGIEISSTAVRIAVVDQRRASLVAWGEAPLPRGAVLDGGIAELAVVRSAIARAALAAGIKRGGGRRHPARVAVGGLRAITRIVELPPLPADEIAAAAQLRALEVIPFPPDRSLIAGRRLPSRAPSETVIVLVEAAHRDLVEPIVAVAGEAGFDVRGVEPCSAALLRALEQVEPDASDVAEAIVSIGAELTTVVVHEAGDLRFVRTIASGGAVVTEALAATLDVPFADAEAIKTSLAEVTTSYPTSAVAAARDALAPLVDEIRSSLVYYASLPSSVTVSRVVLVGGGAELAGLRELMSQQTGLPVISRSCLQRLAKVSTAINRQDVAFRGAVAVGLAMPERRREQAIDLLPPEIRLRRRQREVEHLALAGAGLLFVAAFAGGSLRFEQLHSAQSGVAGLSRSISTLEAQVPAYNRLTSLDAAAAHDEELARPLVSQEVDWPDVIGALETDTPQLVKTTSFGGAVNGVSTSTDASSTSSATAATGAVPENPNPPSASEVLGTIRLSLSAASYPVFEQWFTAITNSHRLLVLQYSGLTASSSSVNFTAELEITGALHSNRLERFEEVLP